MSGRIPGHVLDGIYRSAAITGTDLDHDGIYRSAAMTGTDLDQTIPVSTRVLCAVINELEEHRRQAAIRQPDPTPHRETSARTLSGCESG